MLLLDGRRRQPQALARAAFLDMTPPSPEQNYCDADSIQQAECVSAV